MDPPSSVQLTGIQNGQAQFGWAPVDSCTPVHYAISTNCSTQCSPMTTNQTTTSCTVSEPATDVVVCDFNVQSVVCGNLVGDLHTAVVSFQGKSIQYHDRDKFVYVFLSNASTEQMWGEGGGGSSYYK